MFDEKINKLTERVGNVNKLMIKICLMLYLIYIAKQILINII
ncbi:hypothetical protein [Clostridium botulinum]|nr:hypothetical protein [Clostridium botulinum]